MLAVTGHRELPALSLPKLDQQRASSYAVRLGNVRSQVGWFRYRKNCIANSHKRDYDAGRFLFTQNEPLFLRLLKAIYNRLHSLKVVICPSFAQTLKKFSLFGLYPPEEEEEVLLKSFQ